MSKFKVGDHVRHKQSDAHVFEIVDVLESVPPGIAWLYVCKAINGGDKRKRYTYSQTDLEAYPQGESI